MGHEDAIEAHGLAACGIERLLTLVLEHGGEGTTSVVEGCGHEAKLPGDVVEAGVGLA